MTQPWWSAGGAKPVIAADFGSGWAFDGESCSLSTDSVRAILSFDCELMVDRWFPSSKMCNDCGHIHQELKLSEREWTCQACGSIHDRGYNAALNILIEGASSIRLGDVRPALQAVAV